MTASTRETRFIALLRSINIGGRRVAMEDLRRHFEALKFADVTTFIASGNVIFHTRRKADAAALERTIEGHLRDVLGYDVPTFLRTPRELVDVNERVPFAASDLANPEYSVSVGFLREAPASGVATALERHSTPVDAVAVRGRELYWLRRGNSAVSTIAWPTIERALKLEVTMRNITTVRNLIEKYPAAARP